MHTCSEYSKHICLEYARNPFDPQRPRAWASQTPPCPALRAKEQLARREKDVADLKKRVAELEAVEQTSYADANFTSSKMNTEKYFDALSGKTPHGKTS